MRETRKERGGRDELRSARDAQMSRQAGTAQKDREDGGAPLAQSPQALSTAHSRPECSRDVAQVGARRI